LKQIKDKLFSQSEISKVKEPEAKKVVDKVVKKPTFVEQSIVDIPKPKDPLVSKPRKQPSPLPQKQPDPFEAPR
jgi:hypothetical protein